MLVDALDKRIIEQLQRDGRCTFVTIGKSIGLSEAAVRVRVRRLQEAGVMQVVAVTDPALLGYARLALIGIRTASDLEETADELAALDEIDYLVITAGSFDLMAEVICRDDEHLLAMLHRIRGVKGVTATEVFVYLHIAKEIYNWGTA